MFYLAIVQIQLLMCFSLSLPEVQPFYIGVPVTHRRKRRRHRSHVRDADQDSRHSHYDHYTRHDHLQRDYYNDREDPCDDEEGNTEHHEHADPTG